MKSNNILEITHLVKNYQDTKDEIKAIDDFSYNVSEGKFISIVGPSGCGKSTLLSILANLEDKSSGSIKFNKDNIVLGYMLQKDSLFPWLTILDNCLLGLEIKNIKTEDNISYVNHLLDSYGLAEFKNKYPSSLSGGMRQRVALIRTLAIHPDILLLDEPLSNLDARLRLEMREEIRRIQQETKVTTIFVTHDQEEAMSISDMIVLMKDGQLQQLDTPQQLYDDPNNEFVASFLGNPPINKLTGVINENKDFVLETSDVINLENPNVKPGQKVTLGIRPEAIMLNQDNYDMRSTIVQRYTMGKEELAFVKVGNSEIRVYLSSDYTYKVGDQVDIKLRNKGIFLFDQQTGERI